MATDEKSNEITAIPELIDQIQVEGTIVTIDAAGCQRNIAEQIIDRGGDYVLALKGNQGKTYAAAEKWIQEQLEKGFVGTKARKLEVTETSHGRVDEYLYVQLPLPESFPEKDKWSGLTTLGVAVRHSTQGEKETSDVRYFLSSLPLGVKQFARTVRGHWSIENTLHWCLDVTFREDESRLRDRIAADNASRSQRKISIAYRLIRAPSDSISRRLFTIRRTIVITVPQERR